jgi:hypothetical protein
VLASAIVKRFERRIARWVVWWGVDPSFWASNGATKKKNN